MSTMNDVWGNFTSSGNSFPEFMLDIERHFSGLMKESARVPQDVYEHVQAFVAAVNWKEPWLIGLISFHIIMLLVVLLTRKRFTFQTIIFVFLCVVIRCSEYLNSLCAENWRFFSTQNYFDKHGVFAGIFFAGPLLFIGFVQLVSYAKMILLCSVYHCCFQISFLFQSSSLLIKVKRMELAQHRRKRENDPSSTPEQSNNIQIDRGNIASAAGSNESSNGNIRHRNKAN